MIFVEKHLKVQNKNETTKLLFHKYAGEGYSSMQSIFMYAKYIHKSICCLKIFLIQLNSYKYKSNSSKKMHQFYIKIRKWFKTVL